MAGRAARSAAPGLKEPDQILLLSFLCHDRGATPHPARSRGGDGPGTTAPSMQRAAAGHETASPQGFEKWFHGAPRAPADWPGRGEVRGSK